MHSANCFSFEITFSTFGGSRTVSSKKLTKPLIQVWLSWYKFPVSPSNEQLNYFSAHIAAHYDISILLAKLNYSKFVLNNTPLWLAFSVKFFHPRLKLSKPRKTRWRLLTKKVSENVTLDTSGRQTLVSSKSWSLILYTILLILISSKKTNILLIFYPNKRSTELAFYTLISLLRNTVEKIQTKTYRQDLNPYIPLPFWT